MPGRHGLDAAIGSPGVHAIFEGVGDPERERRALGELNRPFSVPASSVLFASMAERRSLDQRRERELEHIAGSLDGVGRGQSGCDSDPP